MTSLAYVLGAFALLYVVLSALLYVKQDNFLFFRVSNDALLAKRWQAQRVLIPGAVDIEGWWADGASAESEATILYFGGNAEDVLYTAESAKRFAARRMLVTNYRGYGTTPGDPSEPALFTDALAIYDFATKQPNVTANNIVVMGRSLGSGVATYVAENRAVRGVVLITPYDSMAAVAQAHYPFFPVRWLLKHKFESDKRAPKINVPVLMLAAAEDSIVSPSHARQLLDAWAGPKRLAVLTGVGHNDIDTQALYYRHIDEFLAAPAK